MNGMRLYFTTDIHGSDICFRKFINSAKFYKAEVLILGGDITGKLIMPIIPAGSDNYTFTWHGEEHCISRTELSNATKQLRDAGYYPAILTPEEVKLLQTDQSHVEELFVKLACESINRWMDLAEDRLQGTGIECYISPGNDDPLAIDAILNRGGLVINPEERVVTLRGEWEMISMGTTNITPWNSPRELPEDQLESRLVALARQVKNQAKAIYNIHVPPYNTSIDKAPKLDNNLKPYVIPGGVQMAPVGSTAVTNVIKRYQPMLALHGHVHESRGNVKLGRTLCINPGSEYGEGVLRGVLVQLGKKGVEDFLLTSG
ncbi:MAG: metallophosphoesterase family protein [Ktedonobacteraceae bacterium]